MTGTGLLLIFTSIFIWVGGGLLVEYLISRDGRGDS